MFYDFSNYQYLSSEEKLEGFQFQTAVQACLLDYVCADLTVDSLGDRLMEQILQSTLLSDWDEKKIYIFLMGELPFIERFFAEKENVWSNKFSDNFKHLKPTGLKYAIQKDSKFAELIGN